MSVLLVLLDECNTLQGKGTLTIVCCEFAPILYGSTYDMNPAPLMWGFTHSPDNAAPFTEVHAWTELSGD